MKQVPTPSIKDFDLSTLRHLWRPIHLGEGIGDAATRSLLLLQKQVLPMNAAAAVLAAQS